MALPNEATTRKLAAVMFTDIKGFSKKMARNETAALELLRTHDALLRVIASKYEGKVVKSIGDSFMVDFASAVNAVKAAIDAQKRFWNFNKGKEELDMIEVRIGIHLGDVIVSADDMYGDGVNIASRIEAITEPNHICISSDIYNQIKNKIELKVFRMGNIRLKNIPDPVEVFEVLIDSIPELANPSATAKQAEAQQHGEDTAEAEAEEASSIEAAKKRGNTPVPQVEDTASQVEALYRKAEQLYNEGKISDAERTIDEIARIDPGYHAAVERKRSQEEKEKRVNEHYERAGTYIREGKFDLAEQEVKEIFQLFPLHGGAQQLQLQIEEERYRKTEEERNVRLDAERKSRDEKDKQVDDLARAAEEHIEKDELLEARESLQNIYALEPNFTAGERLEEKLRRAEAAKLERERQQAFLEEQKQRQDLLVQNQERQTERQQTRVRHRQEEGVEDTSGRFNMQYVVWIAGALAMMVLAYVSYPKVKRILFPGSASIVVMPFNIAPDDPQEDTLRHIIPTLLADDLSRIERISIVAPTKKNVQASDYPTIATDNQMRYVLHGSVKKSESGFTIDLRLYDNDQHSMLIAQKFDADYLTLNRVRRRIVQAILERVDMEGPAPEIPSPTTNVGAYENYLNGLYLLSKNSLSTLDEAQSDFEVSATLDSTFASSYTGLAQVRISRLNLEPNPNEGMLREAYDFAQKAMRLNPNEYTAYRCLAEISFLTRRFDKVDANIQKCLELQPDDAGCYGILARLDLVGGNYEHAYTNISRAKKRAPDDANLQVVLGLTEQFRRSNPEATAAFKQAIALGLSDSLITSRYLLHAWSAEEDYDSIVTYCQNILKQYPGNYRAYYWISRAFQMKPSITDFKNWSEKGIALLRAYLDKNPDDATGHAYLALLLARNGKSDDSETEMSNAVALAPKSSEILFLHANMHAIQRKSDLAVSSLKEALSQDFNFSEILNPDFVLMRNDASFTSAITRSLGLK